MLGSKLKMRKEAFPMWKKRRRQEEKCSIRERLSRTFELPFNVLEGLPEIELLGNREAVIEHCQGVLEYDDKVVRINAGKLVVRITGRNLMLKYMTGDGVMVEVFYLNRIFVMRAARRQRGVRVCLSSFFCAGCVDTSDSPPGPARSNGLSICVLTTIFPHGNADGRMGRSPAARR